MRALLLTALLLLPAAAADLDGPWRFSYISATGAKRSGTIDLKVAGGQVTGSISSDRGTAKIDDGHIQGDAISFRMIRRGNGDEVEVRYDGQVRNGVMKLKMQYGSHSPVEITATRPLPDKDLAVKVEKIADGFLGGEGPVWSRKNYLLFSDYDKNRIYKYVPGKQPEVYREESNGANGNAMDTKGRLYSCEYRSRRVTRTLPNGRTEVFVDRFEGKRFNAPNDIVVRRDGHVYFTDPLFTPLDHRDLDFYGVYHVTPGRKKIETLSRTQTRPNGITISPDGKTLFVANSDENNIRAYDLDSQGNASHERIVVSDLPGGADGLRVDVQGNFYVASRGVRVYSADGQYKGRIPTEVNPRNLAFGDPDFKTLYLIGNTLYRVRMDIAGSVQY